MFSDVTPESSLHPLPSDPQLLIVAALPPGTTEPARDMFSSTVLQPVLRRFAYIGPVDYKWEVAKTRYPGADMVAITQARVEGDPTAWGAAFDGGLTYAIVRMQLPHALHPMPLLRRMVIIAGPAARWPNAPAFASFLRNSLPAAPSVADEPKVTTRVFTHGWPNSDGLDAEVLPVAVAFERELLEPVTRMSSPDDVIVAQLRAAVAQRRRRSTLWISRAGLVYLTPLPQYAPVLLSSRVHSMMAIRVMSLADDDLGPEAASCDEHMAWLRRSLQAAWGKEQYQPA